MCNQYKICTKCKESKQVSLFRSRGGNLSHLLKSHCNTCLYKTHKNWINNNQDRVDEYRERDSWTLVKRCARYGLSPEQFIDKYERQERCCAICCSEINIVDSAIDHNHVTGEFRGILCKQCNRALGMFKDSPTILKNALEYLESYGSYGDDD